MNWELEQPITAEIGTEKYKVTIQWRNGQLIGDEPVSLGGKDLGPDPYSLLLASLAACTLSTLRMYIDRKGWDIPHISVTLNMGKDDNDNLTTIIQRDIQFGNDITDEQKEKLLLIATKCPVSKILSNNIIIHTA
jgi:putative redox protein